ncbi:MAG: recombination protein O N-terminal domain-containing protein [Chlamydiales bacterium]|nr:recombination protein O N-terminal domain-containing protein [Chlamydiales bacterium]
MKENKSEGIVLKSFAYKETERILHLFTHDQGIIHLIVKHLSKNLSGLTSLPPFAVGSMFTAKASLTSIRSLMDQS